MYGLVREDNLLIRWAFDEGNGTIVADSVSNSTPLFLDPAARWGEEADGNALSRYSLDISDAQAFAYAESSEMLHVTDSFSLLIWFKTNGLPDDWSQILGKREQLSFSYFTQINPGGETVESSYRLTGQSSQFTSTGPVGIPLNSWNCLVSTYDGKQLLTFLNGKLVGALSLSQTPQNDNGNLGVGGSPDGSNLFKGWIDEIRFYSTPLSPSDVELAYGDGFGDLGASPIFESNASTSEENSTLLISFIDSTGQTVPVSGFSSSDLEISGASLTSFTEHNATHYEVILLANQKPQRIKVRMPAGIAKDDGNFSTSSGSTRITYLDQITGADSLVGWWKFDEALPIVDSNWSPTTLNPSLWLDASDASTVSHSSNSVNQWSDKSGNNYHASQSVEASQPTLISSVQNGKSVLTFDGSDDFFDVNLDFLADSSHSSFLFSKPLHIPIFTVQPTVILEATVYTSASKTAPISG